MIGPNSKSWASTSLGLNAVGLGRGSHTCLKTSNYKWSYDFKIGPFFFGGARGGGGLKPPFPTPVENKKN